MKPRKRKPTQPKTRLKKRDTGRLCLVKFDDIGKVTGMITNVHDRRFADVFIFSERYIDSHVEAGYITELGDYVTPNGLLESLV